MGPFECYYINEFIVLWVDTVYFNMYSYAKCWTYVKDCNRNIVVEVEEKLNEEKVIRENAILWNFAEKCLFSFFGICQNYT